MTLVTVFCPLTAVQITGGKRFVVDCNVNPATLTGHDKMTFVPERIMVSSGGSGRAVPTSATVLFPFAAIAVTLVKPAGTTDWPKFREVPE